MKRRGPLWNTDVVFPSLCFLLNEVTAVSGLLQVIEVDGAY